MTEHMLIHNDLLIKVELVNLQNKLSYYYKVIRNKLREVYVFFSVLANLGV